MLSVVMPDAFVVICSEDPERLATCLRRAVDLQTARTTITSLVSCSKARCTASPNLESVALTTHVHSVPPTHSGESLLVPVLRYLVEHVVDHTNVAQHQNVIPPDNL